MVKWLHQLFNPHCQHCADERREQREQLREDRVCVSCESLARENDRLVRENERLLNLLLEKPNTGEQKITSVEGLKPIQTTKLPFVPTAVRRQILETEARHTASLKQNAPQPDAVKVDAELQALDKELQDVRQERESKTAVN